MPSNWTSSSFLSEESGTGPPLPLRRSKRGCRHLRQGSRAPACHIRQINARGLLNLADLRLSPKPAPSRGDTCEPDGRVRRIALGIGRMDRLARSRRRSILRPVPKETSPQPGSIPRAPGRSPTRRLRSILSSNVEKSRVPGHQPRCPSCVRSDPFWIGYPVPKSGTGAAGHRCSKVR